MNIQTHFTVRAAERGLEPSFALQLDLCKAISDPIKYHNYVEKVINLHSGRSLWRFRATPNQHHYAVAKEDPSMPFGVAIMTVLTEEMARLCKAQKKRIP